MTNGSPSQEGSFFLTAQLREAYTLSDEEGKETWKSMHLWTVVRL